MATNPLPNSAYFENFASTYPQYRQFLGKGTLEKFDEVGFEQLAKTDPDFLNNFFAVSLRSVLQYINIAEVRDSLEIAGFGQKFSENYGGYIQRMAVSSVKPATPVYNSLENGKSYDPGIVRKTPVQERFFRYNFDYYSWITIPDEFQRKQIFASPYGVDALVSGIMEGLANGYKVTKYEAKLESLNAILNATGFPLQDSQKVTVTMTKDSDGNLAPTQGDLVNFITSLKILYEAMRSAVSSTAYNAYKFDTATDPSRLKLLIRPGILPYLETTTLPWTTNVAGLSLGVPTIVVPNFGGLKPQDASGSALYPVYDDGGVQIGFSTKSGSSTVTVENSDVTWKDPNADVLAILADDRVISEVTQNPYTVEAWRNPRGRYNNMHASSPNNTIFYDSIYPVVAIYTA